MVEEIAGQKYDATGEKLSGGVLSKPGILEYSKVLIFLTNILKIFTEVSNYLQISPGIGSYFFRLLMKLIKCIHIKALPRSRCSFIKPLV